MSAPVSVRISGENLKSTPSSPQNVSIILYFATGDGTLDVIMSPNSNPKKRAGELKYSLLKQVRALATPRSPRCLVSFHALSTRV
jgi:hypothetical protein